MTTRAAGEHAWQACLAALLLQALVEQLRTLAGPRGACRSAGLECCNLSGSGRVRVAGCWPVAGTIRVSHGGRKV